MLNKWWSKDHLHTKRHGPRGTTQGNLRHHWNYSLSCLALERLTMSLPLWCWGWGNLEEDIWDAAHYARKSTQTQEENNNFIEDGFCHEMMIFAAHSDGGLNVQKCSNMYQQCSSNWRSQTTSGLPLKYRAVRSSEVASSTTYRPSELPIHIQLLSLQGPTQKRMEK